MSRDGSPPKAGARPLPRPYDGLGELNQKGDGHALAVVRGRLRRTDGSGGRARTYNMRINSALLYH